MPQNLPVPIAGLQDGCLCQPAGFKPGRCHHPHLANEERAGVGSLNSMIGQQVLLVGFRLQVSRWEAQVYKTELVPILTTGLESVTSTARRVKRNHREVEEGYPRRRAQYMQRPRAGTGPGISGSMGGICAGEGTGEGRLGQRKTQTRQGWGSSRSSRFSLSVRGGSCHCSPGSVRYERWGPYKFPRCPLPPCAAPPMGVAGNYESPP